MNFSGVECTSSGLTKVSVEPHQQVTSREAREILRIQDTCIRRRLVRVVPENVPAAKAEVLQLGKRNEFLDERRARVRALAQPNGAHLRERPHGLRLASADELDAGHKGRADSAQARKQHPEFSLGGRYFGRLFHAAPFIERSQYDRQKKMNLEKELPQRKRAASPNKQIMMREDLRICKSKGQEQARPASIHLWEGRSSQMAASSSPRTQEQNPCKPRSFTSV